MTVCSVHSGGCTTHRGPTLLNLIPVPSDLTAQVTYSLDGCVRNLHMEQAPVDLDQPTSSFHVGTCFANAEKGTYFDGTGFATAGKLHLLPFC